MSRAAARRKAKNRPDPAAEAFEQGQARVRTHTALAAGAGRICRDAACSVPTPPGALVVTDSCGLLHVHRLPRTDPDTWAWALAHGLLHLGLGHLPAARGDRPQPDRYALAARCAVVDRFLAASPVGRAPEHLPAAYPSGDEEGIAAGWRREGRVPAEYAGCGTGGTGPDQLLAPWPDWQQLPDWQLAFAHALTRTVSAAMDVAGGRRSELTGEREVRRAWTRALDWFVASYPLLGGIAAAMTLVADAELARAHGISVAAVDAAAGEIYVNPLIRLTEEEWRFVLGHEMLHAALRHGERCGVRDAYVFNLAADYVVNGWLREMRVGEMPTGLLYDPGLAGLSVEEVYDRIVTDARRARRLATLRGRGRGDILGEPLPRAADRPYVDLDELYRRGLVNGLDLHRERERGLLPAGLVQEIRALSQPPLPWDARLARWFDETVPRPWPVRSFARPARRQAATPDIPRAGRYFPPEDVTRCTFGVVLDTSGSMDRTLLGKALGAIASYAVARDVPGVRVVFCDAAPYDAGYLPPEEIAGRVRVRGRGGTLLQPGIELLGRAADFPREAPVLVITDGYCDVLRVRREHAFLVPRGSSLPFTPRGPVFHVR